MWRRDWHSNVSIPRCAYLKELGREGAVLAIVQDETLAKMSEMALWLAHPGEFGRPPDRMALFDRRKMLWTPTNDMRPCDSFGLTTRRRSASALSSAGVLNVFV